MGGGDRTEPRLAIATIICSIDVATIQFGRQQVSCSLLLLLLLPLLFIRADVNSQCPVLTPTGEQTLQVAKTAEFSQAMPNFRLDQYHSLDEIYTFLEAIPKRFKRTQLFTIGQTSEGRPIKVLELINNGSDPNYVWLDALTHAQEWVTGSIILYIIDQLLVGGQHRQQEEQTEAGTLIGQRNYVIVPVVNPDGYSYSWTHNRLWRKNRSLPPGVDDYGGIEADEDECMGADLNRNFRHKSFGGAGSSNNPCSPIYRGYYPLSEPETRVLADLMKSMKSKIRFYLTMHSFNQLWVCPYAYTTELSASYEKHMRVLSAIQQAVHEVEGVHYGVGPLGRKIYVGSGMSLDFAHDTCGIEHSYLVELRDNGTHGFLLPEDQIMPTARETYAGLRAGLRAALG